MKCSVREVACGLILGLAAYPTGWLPPRTIEEQTAVQDAAKSPAGENSAVQDCSAQQGVDAGAKIQACHDALPATGGVMDARGISGVQLAAAPHSGSKATGITISKSNVTLLLNPSLDLALFAGEDSDEGILVTGSNVHILGNGAILRATRSLANGEYFDYFLVRVRSFRGRPPITGFVSEGVDYRLTVTGKPAGSSAVMGCLQLRADAATSTVSDWSLRFNRCTTVAPKQGVVDFRWYGFYAFSSAGTTERLIRNGEFVGNEFSESDGRCMQVYRGVNIRWSGNRVYDPSPGNPFGGVGIRAIGVDNATIVENQCEVNSDGGFGCIYVGATDGVAGDESKGVVISGNVARFHSVMASGDTYGLRLIGVHDATVTGNVFVNTQARAGAAADGIKISSVASNFNSDILISGNQIKGFLGFQIRNDDAKAVNIVADGNIIGDSADGKTNPIGGSAARLVRWRNN